MKWRERIKIGDLVRFKKRRTSAQVSAAGIAAQERYLREKMPYMLEIGLVVATHGFDPIVAFPSRTSSFAVANLEVC